jgi:hypothetical protein
MSNQLPATPSGQAFSLEDRPDYMLEAFLDEQNILVKPLLLRRLSLLTLLDLQAQLTEKQVSSPPIKKPRLPGDANDKLLSDLLELTLEKIEVAKQLQDIALKQLDTLLEVEAALEAGAKREREENPPPKPPAATGSSKATSGGSKATLSAVAQAPSPLDEELWCVCRKPDDGRPMVACDNGKCSLTWWHVDCVARNMATRGVGVMPDENASWFCPVCTEKANAQSPSVVRKRPKQE